MTVAVRAGGPRAAEASPVIGDAEVLDRVQRDADRVVLCRCGGAGRVAHAPVNGDGERYVRDTCTCTWDRPGPHEPRLPPRRR
ncbi:hypothetical protein [Blastococcus brunescens]|uniref:Uncharacterized protein n=1 Tax=Blastococcus brunescens TaxID=1564165 RepID=A0ABZ1B0L8_9ACTN|nr:hypothetical protein [Blastococcus sp. BMG 8361]WRL64274.1 hypothetical protein U6N30_32825 [Blastococcus sp. BMG 8361]